jgi:hypothetical protein
VLLPQSGPPFVARSIDQRAILVRTEHIARTQQVRQPLSVLPMHSFRFQHFYRRLRTGSCTQTTDSGVNQAVYLCDSPFHSGAPGRYFDGGHEVVLSS